MDLTNNVNNYYWNYNDRLGYGQNGTVYKAYDMTDTDLVKPLAIRLLSIHQLKQSKTLQQIQNCQMVASKILKSEYLFVMKEFIEMGGYQYTLMDLYHSGTLRDKLTHSFKLSEINAIKIIKQIIHGLKDLNEAKFMHLNLAPENILIQKKNIQIKGFTQSVQQSPESQIRFNIGKPGYQSPQILNKEIYSQKADIWSIGVIFYEMIFGAIPFSDQDDQNNIDEFKLHGIKFPYNHQISEISYDFLIKTLQYSENDRANIESLLSHPIMEVKKVEDINQFYYFTDEQLQEIGQLQKEIKSKGQYWVNALQKNHFPKQEVSLEQVTQFLITYNFNKEYIIKFLGFTDQNEIQFSTLKIKLGYLRFEKQEQSIRLEIIKGKYLIKNITDIVFQQGIIIERTFKKFDYDSNEDLNSLEFKNVIKSINFEYNDQEINLIFNYMDQNKDYTIQLDEFILTLESREPIYNFFSQESVEQLSKTCKKLTKNIRSSMMKFQLDIQDLFKQFDSLNRGFLDTNNFQSFVTKFNNHIQTEDAMQIFDLLQNQNMVIEKKEFCLFFS